MVLLLLSFLEVSSLGNGARCQSAQRSYASPPLMGVETAKIVVATNGKGTYETTDQLASAVTASAVRTEAVTVFVRHTSCSLIVMATTPLEGIIQRPSPGSDRTRSV